MSLIQIYALLHVCQIYSWCTQTAGGTVLAWQRKQADVAEGTERNSESCTVSRGIIIIIIDVTGRAGWQGCWFRHKSDGKRHRTAAICCRLALTVDCPFRVRVYGRPGPCTSRSALTGVTFGGIKVAQDRRCTYDVTMRCVRVTIVAVKSTKYCECVFVALGIQHAMRMRRIAWPPLYHIFPHYLINGTIFGGVIEHKM